MKPTRRAEMASELRLACMRISRRVRYEADHDVAPHQFSVLARLDQGPLTPARLAQIERVSAPSMTRTVKCLAERGLVSRTADPDDGRQIIVTLTDEGRATLTGIRRRRDAWMASRLDDLTDDERATLAAATEILTKVAAS